jgi:hypothetical protein
VPGREAFFDGAPAVNYREVGNESDRKRAATAAAESLYNMGIDAEFLQQSGPKLSDEEQLNFARLLSGNDAFFESGSAFWGPTSWLPDLLNNPHLFGSGYAISGGRNVLSVVRLADRSFGDFSTGAESFQTRNPGQVRVRFITPYKDAAYAVSVTPHARDGTAVMAHVRRKTASYCDLEFLTFSDEGVQRLDKLSFDLAVFGDLAPTE